MEKDQNQTIQSGDSGNNAPATKNKMQKKYAIVAISLIGVLVIVGLSVGLAILFKNDQPQSTNIEVSAKTLTIDAENLRMSAVVPNNVNVFSLADDLILPEDAIISYISNDQGYASGANMEVMLNEGENNFLIVIKQGQKKREYRVAIYRNHIFEVFFDANNGTPITSQKVEEGSFVVANSAEKKGYKFDGWDVDFSQPIKENIVAHVKWIPNTYTLTLDANGGDLGTQSTIVSIVYGEKLNVANPTRTGYDFYGWKIQSNGKDYYGGNWETANDDILIAQWRAKPVSITVKKELVNAVNADGAGVESTEGGSGSGNFRSDDVCTLTAAPSKGYSFVGWYENGEEVTKEKEYQFTVANIPRTFTAKYKAIIEGMEKFYFSTENEEDDYVITGTREKGLEEIYLPDCVASVQNGAFQSSIDTVKSYIAPFLGGGENCDLGSISYVFGASNINEYERYAPKKLTTVTVTKSIKDYALYKCTGVKTVTIGEEVTSIGSSAFNGCVSLETLNGEEYATEIGSSAFRNCQKLESFSMNENVNIISSYTFDGCISLSDITVPTTVREFGSYAFRNSKLSSITFNEQLFSIGDGAFENTKIKTIVVPNNVTYYNLGDACFAGSDLEYAEINCKKNVTLPNRNILSKGSFRGCKNLKTVTLSQCDDIGEEAFYECESLETLTLPQNLVTINNYAFYNCKKLTDIGLKDTHVKGINEYAFKGCELLNDSLPTYPEKITILGHAFDGCINMSGELSLTKVSAIGENAFYGCGFSAIDLGEKIEFLKPHVFANCKALESILIPKQIKEINASAFEGCENLEELSFESGSNIASISQFAFKDCNIKVATIPTSASYIGEKVFQNNDEMVELSVPFIGSGTRNTIQPLGFFFDGTNSTSKGVPSTLTKLSITKNLQSSLSIASLYGCSQIKELYIYDNMVFSFGCLGSLTALEKLSIPYLYVSSSSYPNKEYLGQLFTNDSVSADNHSSYVPSTLKSVTITNPSDEHVIGNYAFKNCANIEEISIEGKSIGESAFEGCESLTSVTLGDSIVTINKNAFKNCTALDDVIFVFNEKWKYDDGYAYYDIADSNEFLTYLREGNKLVKTN